MRPKRLISSIAGWSSRLSKGGEIGITELLEVAIPLLGVLI
jgi:hypothetical protein